MRSAARLAEAARIGVFAPSVKPALLFVALAGEGSMLLAAGAHQARADGGDANAFEAQLGVQAFGEASERKFRGDVREQVRHGNLAADGGDVDDGAMAADSVDRRAEQIRNRGVDGVQRGEKVGLHGAVIGVDGLVAEGADLDDSGVVDKDVEPAEVADGLVDEERRLRGIGEVAGDKKDVVRVGDVAGFEKLAACFEEFFAIARGEDKAHTGAAEAVGERESQAAGTAGNDDHLAGKQAGPQGIERAGECGGGSRGEDWKSSGFLHA